MRMKRSEIYKAILEDAFKRMHDEKLIDDDAYDDAIDYISSGEFGNIECESLHANYKPIVKAIIGWDGSNDKEINVGDKVYYEIAAGEQLDYYREISVYSESSKYALISVANLYDDVQANKVNSFLLNVEFIWSAISGDNDAMKEFWDRCSEKQENSFYIITDENLSSNEEIWNAYSYGYMLYANSREYERDSQLNYHKENKFAGTIPYIKENMYSQYYELFDLISESHYCDDVLRRYLNMYQIIENMCYRRHLAKISRGSKRGFVRHSIAIASRANKNETDEIVKGIMELFRGRKYQKVELQLYQSLETLTEVPSISSYINNKKRKVCLMSYLIKRTEDNAVNAFNRNRLMEAEEAGENGAQISCPQIEQFGFDYYRISHDYSFRISNSK